tara:strand:- start:2684 stop:3043 length:360 start_codon:yes stop_codon:yes gene_type:complete
MKLFPKIPTSKLCFTNEAFASSYTTPARYTRLLFPARSYFLSVNAQKTPALAGLAAVLVVVDYQMAPKLAFVLEFLRQLLQLRFSCSKSRHDGARAGASASPPAPVGSGVAESGAHAPA